MSEKIGKEQIKREDGHLYYIASDGYVWKTPQRWNKSGKKERVGTEKITKKAGHLYFLSSDGYIHEAKMKNA